MTPAEYARGSNLGCDIFGRVDSFRQSPIIKVLYGLLAELTPKAFLSERQHTINVMAHVKPEKYTFCEKKSLTFSQTNNRQNDVYLVGFRKTGAF